MQWKWFALYDAKNGKYYAARSGYAPKPYSINKRPIILMHTVLTGFGRTDHIDGDTLNNRRRNLRDSTPSQNQANRKLQKNNTTGFKGVCKISGKDKWVAYIRVKGKVINLGTFKTPEEAHEAYMKAALFYFGEFANAG